MDTIGNAEGPHCERRCQRTVTRARAKPQRVASRSHDRAHWKDPRWERPRDGREGLETRRGLDTVPALCEGAVPEGSKPSLTREVGLETNGRGGTGRPRLRGGRGAQGWPQGQGGRGKGLPEQRNQMAG